MDRRTKILATLFSLVLIYALGSSVVYPRWIKPIVEIDKNIAKSQEQLDKLSEVEDRVERGRAEYRSMAARIGSFDPMKVQTDVSSQITALIEKHDLQNQSVVPSRVTEDKKTGLSRMQITVSAEGKFAQVIGFLKDMAEMPHLMRVGNASISPAGATKKGESRDRIDLRVPLQILIIPQNRTVGRIGDDELVRPEGLPPRHQGRDYAALWERKPFREPVPLKADAGRDASKKQKHPLRLAGTATGGEPPYKCLWSPSDTIPDPTDCKAEVRTDVSGKRSYTLTITDDEGVTATDTVVVDIEAPPPQRLPDPGTETRASRRPTAPPPAGPWPEASRMRIAMALLWKPGAETMGELMVFNTKGGQTQYFGVGDDFNGGELVFVHPRGGIARRNREYLLYPVGEWLSEEVRAGAPQAQMNHPELNEVAAQLIRAEMARESASKAAKEDASSKVATEKDGQTDAVADGPAAVPSERQATKPAQTIALPPRRTVDSKEVESSKDKKSPAPRMSKTRSSGRRSGARKVKSVSGKRRSSGEPRLRKVSP